MTLRITGTNMDVGSALRERIEDRLNGAVDKYFDGGFSGNVIVSKDGHGKQFRCECRLHLDSGVDLVASGQDGDANRSFDLCAERIEKRLRRYKRKLRDHHGRAEKSDSLLAAGDYILEGPDTEDEVGPDDGPIVIAEAQTKLRTMTVSMAMMDLDLRELTALMFRNAAHGGLNVVYRRPDGNVGWIDPTPDITEN